MVDLSKILFNNKLLNDVISLRVTPFLWCDFIYIYICFSKKRKKTLYIYTLNSLTKNKYNQTLRG